MENWSLNLGDMAASSGIGSALYLIGQYWYSCTSKASKVGCTPRSIWFDRCGHPALLPLLSSNAICLPSSGSGIGIATASAAPRITTAIALELSRGLLVQKYQYWLGLLVQKYQYWRFIFIDMIVVGNWILNTLSPQEFFLIIFLNGMIVVGNWIRLDTWLLKSFFAFF